MSMIDFLSVTLPFFVNMKRLMIALDYVLRSEKLTYNRYNVETIVFRVFSARTMFIWDTGLNTRKHKIVPLGNERTSLKLAFGDVCQLKENQLDMIIGLHQCEDNSSGYLGDIYAPLPNKLLIHRIHTAVILPPIAHY